MGKYRIRVDDESSGRELLDLRAYIEPATIDVIIADIYDTLSEMANEQKPPTTIKQSKSVEKEKK